MPERSGRPPFAPLFGLSTVAALLLFRCAAAPPDIPVVPLENWRYVEGRPAPAADHLGSRDSEILVQAWGQIQAGRLGSAEQLLAGLRTLEEGDAAVLVTDGFLQLRSGRAEDAERLFARALEADADQADAALGAGLIALQGGDAENRFVHLTRLARLEPNAPLASERLPALRMEVADLRLARARGLRRGGAPDPEVTDAYRALLEVIPASSSSDVFLEAAEAAAAAGAREAARDWFDQAARVPGASRSVAIGARLSAAEMLAEAGDAFSSLERLDAILADPALPTLDDLADRADRLAMRLAVARNNQELARVREEERITREQLAAVLIAELGEPRSEAGGRDDVDPEQFIAVDLESSWAADLVRRTVRSGYLSLFPDHTFKPRDFVSRTDLAETLVAALAVLDAPTYDRILRESGTAQFSDLPVGHRSREAGVIVVQLGLLQASAGEFRPRDFASGAEAVRAVRALRDVLSEG